MKIRTGNGGIFGLAVLALLVIVAVAVSVAEDPTALESIYDARAKLPPYEQKVMMAKELSVVIFIHSVFWKPRVKATVDGVEHDIRPMGKCNKDSTCYGVPDPQSLSMNFKKRFVYVIPTQSTNVTIDSHPTELREGVFVHHGGQLIDAETYENDDNKNTKIVPVLFTTTSPATRNFQILYHGINLQNNMSNAVRLTEVKDHKFEGAAYMSAIAQPRQMQITVVSIQDEQTNKIVNDSYGQYGDNVIPNDAIALFVSAPNYDLRFLTERMLAGGGASGPIAKDAVPETSTPEKSVNAEAKEEEMEEEEPQEEEEPEEEKEEEPEEEEKEEKKKEEAEEADESNKTKSEDSKSEEKSEESGKEGAKESEEKKPGSSGKEAAEERAGSFRVLDEQSGITSPQGVENDSSTEAGEEEEEEEENVDGDSKY